MDERTLVITFAHDWDPVRGWLRAAGFPQVAVDPPAALQALTAAEPCFAAAVLLVSGDVAHTRQGHALCRAVRADARLHHLPLLWVVREGTPVDLYDAFNAGASGYVSGPPDALEFVLRLRALIRRAARHAPIRHLKIGDVRLDLDAHEVRAGEKTASLTPRETAILRHLAGQRGQPTTTEDLLVKALGYPPRQGNPEVVRTHVRHLREKLEVDPSAPRLLLNVPRVGYRLVVDAAKP